MSHPMQRLVFHVTGSFFVIAGLCLSMKFWHVGGFLLLPLVLALMIRLWAGSLTYQSSFNRKSEWHFRAETEKIVNVSHFSGRKCWSRNASTRRSSIFRDLLPFPILWQNIEQCHSNSAIKTDSISNIPILVTLRSFRYVPNHIE